MDLQIEGVVFSKTNFKHLEMIGPYISCTEPGYTVQRLDFQCHDDGLIHFEDKFFDVSFDNFRYSFEEMNNSTFWCERDFIVTPEDIKEAEERILRSPDVWDPELDEVSMDGLVPIDIYGFLKLLHLN